MWIKITNNEELKVVLDIVIPEDNNYHDIQIVNNAIYVDGTVKATKLDDEWIFHTSLSTRELEKLHKSQNQSRQDCLSCNWIEWNDDDKWKTSGICAYPLPEWTERPLIIKGIWCAYTRDGITSHIQDSSRVGYKHTDGSIIEIRNCPTHSSRQECP